MWRPTVLVLVAALAACSGDDGAGAPAPTGSTSTSAVVASSSSMPATSAAPTTSAAPSTTAPSTTALPSTTTLPTTSTGPATTTTMSCPGPAFDLVARSGAGEAITPALLTTVRVARHDCYDRVVFELAPAMPEWRVAPAVPPFAGPSDIPVDVRGTSWLHVRLATTDAHTEDGKATVGPTPVPVRDAAAIQQVQLIEDFEGIVVFVIGLDRERPFRVQTIADPPRLVIDVRTA